MSATEQQVVEDCETWRSKKQYEQACLKKDTTNESATEQFANKASWQQWVQALLQSSSFPQTPVPTVTIADVLQLQQTQRFDLMAIVAKILDERKAGTGMHIADVRLVDGSKELVDGSKENDRNTTEYASLPLTLFSKMRQN